MEKVKKFLEKAMMKNKNKNSTQSVETLKAARPFNDNEQEKLSQREIFSNEIVNFIDLIPTDF
jgi:hypothetical protein